MGNTIVTKAELSYKDIFHICKDLYNSLLYNMFKTHVYSKLKKECNVFNQRVQHDPHPNYNFTSPCEKHGLYLHEIKHKKSENYRKPYCNFYIYQLKRELKHKIPKIYRFDEAHDQLINVYKKSGVHIPDVCKEYVSLMEDNGLIKPDKITLNNNTIQEELDKFRRDFHEYPLGNTYKYEDELLKSSLGKVDISATTAEALSGDSTNSVTRTSTGVLFFAILIIIFIVYNVKNKFN
ncbi:variable surface protein [Plasmodium gonderi]|uniref:Variable surface protein n=1 Tax=Plasmodium gonderi TaxID=77519 RepID=A0A1Y1JS14_PLAGO|nr:variable surface protein [Plasmodium gonderi]GAW84238.1 variable surface protein [Plasmodium gonderi]